MKEINFYSIDEIEEIFKCNEKLVYIDDGICETIGKYEDLPDIIVDLNEKLGLIDLKIYDYQHNSSTPIATTLGMYLDKCNADVRKDIIDRLINLQLGEEKIKDYKLIDEFDLEEYQSR